MSKLSELEPVRSQRLMDLVAEAGVDVTDWGNFAKGKAYAASNPKYCYEWSFVERNKVAVFNLWYEGMEEDAQGVVFVRLNMREDASTRVGPSADRAIAMDKAIKLAIRQKLPIRVVVIAGDRKSARSLEGSSQVRKRLLDPVAWSVTEYDDNTGECVLTRDRNRIVDQFSIQTEPAGLPRRHNISGQAFDRDPRVRDRVLQRSNGTCEWCGQAGFLMANGSVYLETHHVVPLSEKGLDIESNVAALCPNHHREAHHGKSRETMRHELLKRVKKA